MSTFALLAVTGLGLGALYFMVASGLSLILGLMRVLNLAHGAFLTVAAYAAWSVIQMIPDQTGWLAMVVAIVVGIVAGGLFATLTEMILIRPLYRREIGQVLVTVGLWLATVSLIHGIFGADQKIIALPTALTETTAILGAAIPNARLIIIAFAVVLYLLLYFFLKRTRYGLITVSYTHLTLPTILRV